MDYKKILPESQRSHRRPYLMYARLKLILLYSLVFAKKERFFKVIKLFIRPNQKGDKRTVNRVTKKWILKKNSKVKHQISNHSYEGIFLNFRLHFTFTLMCLFTVCLLFYSYSHYLKKCFKLAYYQN